MDTPTLDELLELALAAARGAGEVALRYFTRDVQVEVKSDQTPVTVADREAERLLMDQDRGALSGPRHRRRRVRRCP